MSWIKVLPVDSLPQDARQVVKVGKRNILLLDHDSQLIAVDNTCPLLLSIGEPLNEVRSPWLNN